MKTKIADNPYLTEQASWYPQWTKEQNEWWNSHYKWNEEIEDWVYEK